MANPQVNHVTNSPRKGKRNSNHQEASTRRSDETNSDTSTTARYLESIINDIVTGINTRCFDSASALYKHKIDPSEWITHLRNPAICVIGWPGYQEHMEEATSMWPGYQIRIRDCNTYVDEAIACAQSFVTVETWNRPPGVVRQSIAVCRFRRREGVALTGWKCIAFDILDGIDCSSTL